jgi:4-hydroxythreonine-4-phosphate dehydrogenase
MTKSKPLILITLGDPCGVGPEIVLKALTGVKPRRICRPIVVGNADVLTKTAAKIGLKVDIRRLDRIDNARFKTKQIEVLDPSGGSPLSFQWGRPTAQTAAATLEAVRQAAELCLTGKADAMATAPLNKAALQKIGFPFPGHTEFLASLTGSKEYGMMMVGGRLKIILTTIHEPLASVPSLLTTERIAASIRLAHRTLSTWFKVPKPKIAVAALNPHAGEEGMFGREEAEIVLPAVQSAQKEVIDVYGPFPADTLFRRLSEGEFDVAVALYHDQALIPLKLLAFGRGVNVTVGIPIIRTSVDHGTAYDIAGKGEADPGSLIEAIRIAVQMARAAGTPASKFGRKTE